MTRMAFFSLITRLIVYLIFLSEKRTLALQEFEIDYSNNTFVKDQKPFRYASGSFHYSRVHPVYWQDRLRKMRSAGLNAVQTYVPWNVHETVQGRFKWDGFSDLDRFLTLAKEENLVVLLRLGPYICGEWEFGGFPAWLLTENPNMVLRTSDPAYMKWVVLWFNQLLPKVKPHLYKNGGPVVMVQIENEYGSYFACDKNYMSHLRDLVISELGSDVIIYTTDGAGDGFLRCGTTEMVYATVDFGVTYTPAKTFQPQRDYEPKGPLVNSEFYTGWLDHWGTPHSTVNMFSLAKSLDILLGYNTSNINMYMFVGGTNFGFFNGANEPSYQPVPTSYDYDSPITEAGDITLKYYALRDIVSKYLPLPPGPVPANTTKMNFGSVPVTFMCTVQDALPYMSPTPVPSTYPVWMEKISFYEGFILYRHVLKSNISVPTLLSTWGVRDRAIVMINQVPIGIMDRSRTSLAITGHKNQYLDILVENQGRVGFSTDMNFNRKGLIANVTLGGEILKDWIIYPLNMTNMNDTIVALQRSSHKLKFKAPAVSSNGKWHTPSIYIGNIQFPYQTKGKFYDTYLDPRPFTKGQAFINGFNLGRYWPLRGPQVRLFVPQPVFLPDVSANRLILFEMENAPCQFPAHKLSKCNVALVDRPYLDGPNNPDDENLSYSTKVETHFSKEFAWQQSFYDRQ